MLPFCQNFRKTIGLAFETMPELVIAVTRELCFSICLIWIEEIEIVFAQ